MIDINIYYIWLIYKKYEKKYCLKNQINWLRINMELIN